MKREVEETDTHNRDPREQDSIVTLVRLDDSGPGEGLERGGDEFLLSLSGSVELYFKSLHRPLFSCNDP